MNPVSRRSDAILMVKPIYTIKQYRAQQHPTIGMLSERVQFTSLTMNEISLDFVANFQASGAEFDHAKDRPRRLVSSLAARV